MLHFYLSSKSSDRCDRLGKGFIERSRLRDQHGDIAQRLHRNIYIQ